MKGLPSQLENMFGGLVPLIGYYELRFSTQGLRVLGNCVTIIYEKLQTF